MPTKAGRVRIEDLRVGRVIWDIAVDWGNFGAYARPLVIVSRSFRRHWPDNATFFSVREPEGHIHHFHTRSHLTLCGFWGVDDRQWDDQGIVKYGRCPVNFFVNRRAAERYLERLGQTTYYPKLSAMRESVAHLPKGTRQPDRLTVSRTKPLTPLEQKASDGIVANLRDITLKLYKDSGYRSVSEAMSVQGSGSDVETTPYAKYSPNFVEPTMPLEEAKAVFECSSDSLRKASGAKLHGLKVTPLPADPKDLAQGYSWPIRMEATGQPDRDYSNVWGQSHMESPDSPLTAFSTSRLIEDIKSPPEDGDAKPKADDEVDSDNAV